MMKTSFGFVLCLQIISCSPATVLRHSMEKADDVPGDLRIVLGEGGGITGAWSGYTILASDTILEWGGRSIGERARMAGIINADSVRAFWSFVRESRFLEKNPVLVSANFIQMISVSAGGSFVQFSWSPMADRDTAVSTVAAFRARCLRAVRNVLNR